MARGASEFANNGCTLGQLLGYRGILLNTGTSNISSMLYPEDYMMFSDWLSADICEGMTTRQGLILNGNGIANTMKVQAAALLTQIGAIHLDDRYADYSGDEAYCVRIEAPAAGGELYGTANSTGDYEYDAFGNWCPIKYSFDVLGAAGPGVGNRVYARVDNLGSETQFAQIVSEDLTTDNYRTILDGVSYHLLSSVDPVDECLPSEARIIEAAANELRSALEWIYGVGNLPGLCENPCTSTDSGTPPNGGGSEVLATSLQPARPNPFNPRTTLAFRLAESGEVDVRVFDAAGRRVRTIADGPWDAGAHEVVWDGTDDAGHALSAGVYWVKMQAGGFDYATRVVRLK